MFSVELKEINMDAVASMMETCQAQSLLHWIVKTN